MAVTGAVILLWLTLVLLLRCASPCMFSRRAMERSRCETDVLYVHALRAALPGGNPSRPRDHGFLLQSGFEEAALPRHRGGHTAIFHAF